MTAERWRTFTKSQQLLFVGSELERARVWEGNDKEKFSSALERGLALADLMVDDPQWRDGLAMALGLRQEIARFYAEEGRGSIERIYRAL